MASRARGEAPVTIAVYGIVAAIVKSTTAAWRSPPHPAPAAPGRLSWRAALMKSLSVVRTAAMFLVGGGILAHGIPPLHHLIEALAAGAGARRRHRRRAEGAGDDAARRPDRHRRRRDRPRRRARGSPRLRARRQRRPPSCRGCRTPLSFYFSDSIRSTYSCIASSLDLPLRPFQASHLARPTMSPKPGRLPSASPLGGLLVERVELQQGHVVGLFRQALATRPPPARTAP